MTDDICFKTTSLQQGKCYCMTKRLTPDLMVLTGRSSRLGSGSLKWHHADIFFKFRSKFISFKFRLYLEELLFSTEANQKSWKLYPYVNMMEKHESKPNLKYWDTSSKYYNYPKILTSCFNGISAKLKKKYICK